MKEDMKRNIISTVAAAAVMLAMTACGSGKTDKVAEMGPEQTLEAFCRAGKNLYIKGTIFDIDDEEYRFFSEPGDSYYLNADKVARFNEDDDKEAMDSAD